jgi:predicted DNA-binding protein
VYNIALQVVGAENRKHQDWFDENCDEIKQLLEEKYPLHKSCLTNTKCNATKHSCYNVRRAIQQKLRQMQDTWLSNKADEIQQYADKHDALNALKEVYGPTPSGASPFSVQMGQF